MSSYHPLEVRLLDVMLQNTLDPNVRRLKDGCTCQWQSAADNNPVGWQRLTVLRDEDQEYVGKFLQNEGSEFNAGVDGIEVNE
jgi:hypothetical protein